MVPSSNVQWPDYPMVKVEENKIFILFKNGTTQFWGFENDPDQQSLIIEDIQEGLRAIEFLFFKLQNEIDESMETLTEMGFDGDRKNEILHGGLLRILKEYMPKPMTPKQMDEPGFYIS
ncbi:MAG: hypothetical protein NWE89_17505 [Candidatus Bathyarchaeota archaeon]|nr:hypothetical protein [Candidatus Bathyarchaeota archaeon]